MRSISLTLDAVSCVSKMLRSIVSNMDLTDIKKNPQCDLSIIDNITDLTDKTKPKSIWFELPYLKSDCSYDIRLHDSAWCYVWPETGFFLRGTSASQWRLICERWAELPGRSCFCQLCCQDIINPYSLPYRLSFILHGITEQVVFLSAILREETKVHWLIDWGPRIVVSQPMRASYVHVSFNSSETVPIIHNIKGCKWLVSCCQENFL